jgi:hypothetical protein
LLALAIAVGWWLSLLTVPCSLALGVASGTAHFGAEPD